MCTSTSIRYEQLGSCAFNGTNYINYINISLNEAHSQLEVTLYRGYIYWREKNGVAGVEP